jgi:hypothetical protein
VQAVGDGIAGLVGGAIDAIGAALSGIWSALTSVVPAGVVPVVGVFVLVLVIVAILRR